MLTEFQNLGPARGGGQESPVFSSAREHLGLGFLSRTAKQTSDLLDSGQEAHPKVGEAVGVVGGPLQDLEGTVAQVKPQEGRLRVRISPFGRAYPLELDLVNVEKS